MPKGSSNDVVARIVYWGTEGAGKTQSLMAIHGKLKADHRGDIKRVPTRLDPTVTFEQFPIQLGSINGVRTLLEVVAVPGAPELATTRKQLLDQMDGLVLVLDARAERLDDNLASVAELRESLASYGRTLEEIPSVVQYNKRDLGDPFAIEELHRRLGLADAAVFETVATDGSGILQALTTISKRVVRVMRERNLEPEPEPPPAILRDRPATPVEQTPTTPRPSVTAPIVPPSSPAQAVPAQSVTPTPAATSSDGVMLSAPSQAMEAAILAEGDGLGEEAEGAVRAAEAVLDESWPAPPAGDKAAAGARIGADLKIVSVGTASRQGERGVRVPLVLGNDDGESVTLELSISLDPLLDDGST